MSYIKSLTDEQKEFKDKNAMDLHKQNVNAFITHFNLNPIGLPKAEDPRMKTVYTALEDALFKAPKTPTGSISTLVAVLAMHVANEKQRLAPIVAVAVGYYLACSNLVVKPRPNYSSDIWNEFVWLKQKNLGTIPIDEVGRVMVRYKAYPEILTKDGEVIWPPIKQEIPTQENSVYPAKLLEHLSAQSNTSALLDEVFRILSLAPSAAVEEDCQVAFINTWKAMEDVRY